MAVRMNKCTECGSTSLETIKELNPDTHDANMDVICRCNECGKEDQYKTMSPWNHEQRRLGYWI